MMIDQAAAPADGNETGNVTSDLPWQPGRCRVPMWMAGSPAGHCDKRAYGPQYPRQYLAEVVDGRYMFDRPAYCFGHCCPDHGGPKAGEVILFQDGYTPQGKPMWCAVMPGFENLQESHAAFDGNPVLAARKLAKILSKVQP